MDGHIKGWGRWFLVLALAGASVFAQRPAEGDWREVSAEQMDSRLILDRGRDALGMGGDELAACGDGAFCCPL